MFCIRNPIFGDRRFNSPRAILKPVLESGSLMEQAFLQFCSIFESRVHSFYFGFDLLIESKDILWLCQKINK